MRAGSPPPAVLDAEQLEEMLDSIDATDRERAAVLMAAGQVIRFERWAETTLREKRAEKGERKATSQAREKLFPEPTASKVIERLEHKPGGSREALLLSTALAHARYLRSNSFHLEEATQ